MIPLNYYLYRNKDIIHFFCSALKLYLLLDRSGANFTAYCFIVIRCHCTVHLYLEKEEQSHFLFVYVVGIVTLTLALKPDVIFEIFSFMLSFWGSIIPFVNSGKGKRNRLHTYISSCDPLSNILLIIPKRDYHLPSRITHISLVFLLSCLSLLCARTFLFPLLLLYSPLMLLRSVRHERLI